MPTITDSEFKLFQSYLLKTWGLEIPENKRYLFNMRLTNIFEKKKIRDFSQFYFRLTCLNDESLKTLLIDAMTTNETSFFRDTHYYESLKKTILPEIIDRYTNRVNYISPTIRVLSAGCSTGEEVYSLAITINEILENNKKIHLENFRIIGVDVSSKVLEIAKKGEYPNRVMNKNITDEIRTKYFNKNKNICWQIKEKIRQSVTFYNMSLMDSLSTLGFFDLILCRNVLIYFSDETRKKILTTFKNILLPNSILIVGASESLHDCQNYFTAVHNGKTLYYRVKK